MNIMNKIDWSNPPSTITFAIDYPNSSGAYTTDYPCPVCQATIEEICECVDEIYVCNPETNEPEPQCN